MTGKKRANGEGTIRYDEKREEYIGLIRDGKKPDGKVNRIYFYGGKGGKKSDVVKKMRQWIIAHDKIDSKHNSITVKEGMESWLEIIKKPELKPISFDRLESSVLNHVIPRIGRYPVEKITDGIIKDEVIDAMIKEGLSVSSLKKAYNAVRAYLNYAVFKSIIPFNPMAMMSPPKQCGAKDARIDSEETETDQDDGGVPKPLTMDEVKALSEICVSKWNTGRDRYPMGNAIILILNTGIRMGEALALTWKDINTEAKSLLISKNIVLVKNRGGKSPEKYKLILQDTPKTKRSRRIIPLNRAALSALNGLRCSFGYSPDGYVVHTKDGNPMLPRSLQQTLDLACKAAGIRKIGLHTLRHTYATRLFEKGVDIKIISELLGHSSTEITYKIYIHVIESLKTDAVSKAFDL